MEWRHREFVQAAGPLLKGFRLIRVYNARDAIRALDEGGVVQAFLDHDLSEIDVMSVPGAETENPTGMVVVDHIMGMEEPPDEIVVHSCNGPASIEMVVRLESHPKRPKVRRIAFPMLRYQLELAKEKSR